MIYSVRSRKTSPPVRAQYEITLTIRFPNATMDGAIRVGEGLVFISMKHVGFHMTSC